MVQAGGTRRSFDLRANLPTVTVRAAYSKHRRDGVLPLKRDTAQLLACWRDCVCATDRDVRVLTSLPTKTADLIRADLRIARARWIREAAENLERRERHRSEYLCSKDGAGRVVDFHALRHTFITNLARGGVHPKLAQALARHSTITLTMDRYSHTVLGEQADALSALPDLSNRPDQERHRATGTCDNDAEYLACCLAERHASRAPLDSTPCAVRTRRSESGDARNPLNSFNVMRRDACVDYAIPTMRAVGLEPTTNGLKGRCSTD